MAHDLPCRLMVQVVLLPRSRTTTLVAAAPPAAAITPLFASTVGLLPRGKVATFAGDPAAEMISTEARVSPPAALHPPLRLSVVVCSALIDEEGLEMGGHFDVNGECEFGLNAFTLKEQFDRCFTLLYCSESGSRQQI